MEDRSAGSGTEDGSWDPGTRLGSEVEGVGGWSPCYRVFNLEYVYRHITYIYLWVDVLELYSCLPPEALSLPRSSSMASGFQVVFRTSIKLHHCCASHNFCPLDVFVFFHWKLSPCIAERLQSNSPRWRNSKLYTLQLDFLWWHSRWIWVQSKETILLSIVTHKT